MRKGAHMKEPKVWLKVSLSQNMLMIPAIVAACVWKSADVRYLLGRHEGVFI